MRKPFPVYRRKRVDYSFRQYAIRYKKDASLQDDFEAFISKHEISLGCLVDKLITHHFLSAHQADPEYPV
jgi:hypothetical protein